MLKQLYIKNFTLIDELDIPLYPGFSVITVSYTHLTLPTIA